MTFNPPGPGPLAWPAVLPQAAASEEERFTVTPDQTYESKYTYEQTPQRIGNVEQHHYLQLFTIGVQTGPTNAQQVTPGLTVGSVQRIIAEKAPRYWLISISSKAAGGSINIYEGEPGGPFVPLGPGGYLLIPSRGHVISLVGVGATAFGAVIGLGNFQDFNMAPSPIYNVGAY